MELKLICIVYVWMALEIELELEIGHSPVLCTYQVLLLNTTKGHNKSIRPTPTQVVQ